MSSENIKVIIVADDFYYLNGCTSCLRSEGFITEGYFYTGGGYDNHFWSMILNRYDGYNSILIIAVDDFTIMKHMPNDTNSICIVSPKLLKSTCSNNFLFLFGYYFMRRDLNRNDFIYAIHRIMKGYSTREIKLTRRESECIKFIFQNFRLGTLTGNYLGIGRKQLSQHKRSVYQKLMVHSNSEFFLILKVLEDIGFNEG